MSPTAHFFFYILWIAHPLLEAAVAIVMWRRALRKKFPVFFAYILCQLTVFAVIFPIKVMGSYLVFFYAYWITTAISLAIGFKVIHEVFLDVFRPYHTLKDLGTVVFNWAGLVMLLVAAVVAAASSSSEQGPLVQAVLTVQRCVRVIQCGLILFLILFAKYLGVSRRQQSFGIAMGFGGFAFAELMVFALRASGSISELNVSLVNMLAYDAAIACWLRCLWVKAEAREPAANLLTSQRWDQSLAEIQYPVPADSLIPMFEGMVDRAFSRAGQEVPPEGSEAEHRSVISQMLPDPEDLMVSLPLPRRPPEPR